MTDSTGADKRFLLDFEVEAHSCLEDTLADVQSVHPSGKYEIHINNLAVDPNVDRPLLSVQLIIPANDIGEVQAAGELILREYLHLLTFVTSSSFKIHRLKRIADWTPGLIERRCKYFSAKYQGHAVPYAILEKSTFQTVETLELIEHSPNFRRILRCFANGVSSIYSDDQFQFFYFVLELLARLAKGDIKVNDCCAKCRAPLYCETCKDYPTHKPYPAQAIRLLVEKAVPKGGEVFFSTINKIRNRLLHGDAVEAVEDELKIKLPRVVDQLGKVAWTCICNALFAEFKAQGKHGPLSFVVTKIYSHQSVTAGMDVIATSRDPAKPTLGDLPDLKVSMEFSKAPEPIKPHSQDKGLSE